jgi:hypothetical protein
MIESGVKTYTGSCHCGDVRFEADIDLSQVVNRCNCSFCTKTGTANAIIKPSAFRLLAGDGAVTDYSRTSGPNHAPFCKRCGIHAYGYGNVPELGGEFYSINVNCLDGVDPAHLKYHYWDGRNNAWHNGPRAEPWPQRQAP